jgi:hypothetical protein
MPNQEYQDPILKKYADLIEANTPVFKRIYFGDPIRIGASELPVLILAKVDSRISNMTNTEDLHLVRVSMTIVTDVRDTLSDDKTMVRGVNALYNLMEGRAADYTLKPDSLLYILRHNVELDVGKNLRTDLSTMSTVDYGMTMGKRKEASWSIEGTLTFTSHFTQVR